MKVVINLNDKVRVQLTPAGLAFVNSPANQAPFVPDSQGFIETEFWQLAATFAPLMYNGNPAPPFERMEVELVFRGRFPSF